MIGRGKSVEPKQTTKNKTKKNKQHERTRYLQKILRISLYRG